MGLPLSGPVQVMRCHKSGDKPAALLPGQICINEIDQLLFFPDGTTPLNNAGQYTTVVTVRLSPVLSGQVARAARAAFVQIGTGAWSGFLASTNHANSDATDGSPEAVAAGSPAPPSGVLAGLLSAYLQGAPCNLTPAQAAQQLAAIWAAAPGFAP